MSRRARHETPEEEAMRPQKMKTRNRVRGAKTTHKWPKQKKWGKKQSPR